MIFDENLQDLYVKSTKELTKEQSEKFGILLDRFSDVFATSSKDIGFTTVIEHEIDTGEARPVKQPTRRPPKAFAEEESEII